jgi:hypothetical protein
MAGEDLGLADRLVREEAIGGLGVGSVLTCRGMGVLTEFLVYPGGGTQPERSTEQLVRTCRCSTTPRGQVVQRNPRLYPADVGNRNWLSGTLPVG